MRRTFQRAGNGLTWSFSRDQMLKSCERKYYFQYLIQEAYLNSPDPWRRAIALLKKVKNIPMWQGECVHEAIADSLTQYQEGNDVQFERLALTLQQRMKRDWNFSEKRQFREEPTSIGRFGAALFEHEYNEVAPETQVSELIDEAREMLSRFYRWAHSHPTFLSDFKAAKRRWIEPPPWGDAAPGFMVGEVQAITKVDLALLLQNGQFWVYDWKTGKRPATEKSGMSNSTQVSIYMLWPHLVMNIPLEKVSSTLVYLGDADAQELNFQLDEELAVETKQIIWDSVEQAQRWEGYVKSDRLTLENIDFASSVNECRKCNFKRVCRAALSQRDLP
jgi:PD-(D/E)XK nuclease superfamily